MRYEGLVGSLKKLREEAAAMRYEDKREERKKLIEKIINENGGTISRNLLHEIFIQKTRLSIASTNNLLRKLLNEGFIVQNKSRYIAINSANN